MYSIHQKGWVHRLLSVFAFALLFAPGILFAADTPVATVNNGDNAWMLVCTALVLMMTRSEERRVGKECA